MLHIYLVFVQLHRHVYVSTLVKLCYFAALEWHLIDRLQQSSAIPLVYVSALSKLVILLVLCCLREAFAAVIRSSLEASYPGPCVLTREKQWTYTDTYTLTHINS